MRSFISFAIRALAVSMLLVALARAGHATVITAFPVDFAVNEQSVFNDAVATFEDDNPSAGPADFTATIDWGDGSPTSSGTIGFNSGAFAVIGLHTYADEGSFTVTVTINDVSPGTGTAAATDTATVNEADVLNGTPITFAVPPGVSFTKAVASFTDTLTGTPATDFTATIDWGDGSPTSPGTVSGSGGAFSVSGTHTYAAAGTFTVNVTLSDDKPGTATATVASTAKVAAGLSVTATNFSTPEGVAFNGQVGVFSDANTALTPASFTSTINWGDGNSSAGTITGSNGTFQVSGQHTYADEGSFATNVSVTETGVGGATSSFGATATVTESDVLAGSPVTFTPQQGVPFTGAVATFSDTGYPANVPGDFTATIDWGDGSPTSPGTVSGGAGTFTVSGTHTYATMGTFPVSVTLVDDPPGTATATVTNSVANVGAAPAIVVPTLDVRGLVSLALAMIVGALLLLRARRKA